MAQFRTAEAQRAYRARISAGEWTPTERVIEIPVEVKITDEQRAEMESKWDVEYRRCISAWLIRQKSPHTRRAYHNAWRGWLAWCAERDVSPIEPPNGTGAVWLADLGEKGYAPATRAQWRVGVRQALMELSFDGLRVGGDPFSRVAPERGTSTPVTIIPVSDEDVAKMVAMARELGGQYLTAVLLLAVMGLRSFEAGQVTRETVSRSPWGLVATITGKGRKRALVPIPDLVRDAARLDGWPMDGRKGRDPRERIRTLVDCVNRHAGTNVQPHQLRHWHVTTALAAGVPLERVQDSVRHADPKTTQQYNQARTIVEGHSSFVVANLPVMEGAQT